VHTNLAKIFMYSRVHHLRECFKSSTGWMQCRSLMLQLLKHRIVAQGGPIFRRRPDGDKHHHHQHEQKQTSATPCFVRASLPRSAASLRSLPSRAPPPSMLRPPVPPPRAPHCPLSLLRMQPRYYRTVRPRPHLEHPFAQSFMPVSRCSLSLLYA
jgi:hypothetical protein